MGYMTTPENSPEGVSDKD